MPCLERKAPLLQDFDFTCGCAACTSEYSNLSDERLNEIHPSSTTFLRLAIKKKPALKTSERVLSLMRQKGIYTPVDVGTIHYDAYQMAKVTGNKIKAQTHIRRALECAKLCEGQSSQLAKKYVGPIAKAGR